MSSVTHQYNEFDKLFQRHTFIYVHYKTCLNITE